MADGTPGRRAIALLISAATFVVGMVGGALIYPGGTWFDRGYEGHHVWQSFWCDMLHDPALNGAPNPSVPWAIVGLIAVAVSLALLWSVLGAVLPTQPRLARVAQWVGYAGIVGVIGIPLTPSDAYPLAHTLSVVTGGVMSLSAVGMTVVGMLRERQRWLAAMGGVTLALFLVTLGLYVHQGFFDGTLSVALPAAQKLASLLAVVWFGAIGAGLLRAAPENEVGPEDGVGHSGR